jgi:hypothetical protein
MNKSAKSDPRRRTPSMATITASSLDLWKDCWTKYSLNDATELDLFNRVDAHKKQIIERGGLDENTALVAFNSPEPETKEEVARWLRWELKRLDVLQEKSTGALVLSGKALSRVTIADLAITLLQSCDAKPGPNLICLIAELSGVDRHRTALANNKQEKKKWHLSYLTAALNILGESWSDRRLAKVVGVSPTTVAEWKNDSDFNERVSASEQIIRVDGNFEKVENENPTLSRKEAIELALSRGRRKVFEGG